MPAPKYWFTSDQHFGHDNIRKYCKRPFATVTEMNQYLIAAHNRRVADHDYVYHLGDFAWKDPAQYLKQLKGRHYLIFGNHDRRGQSEKAGFVWYKDVAMIKVPHEVQYIWLSHYAHKIWNRRHFGVLHFFGHSHGTLRDPEPGSIDVGVDAWRYRPVELEEIVTQMFLSGTWKG